MPESLSREPAARASVLVTILPLLGVVLVTFLITGLALPVLPLHVHHGLGLGIFVVGIVTGSQFATSLLSRVSAGHFADSRGAKRAVIVGLSAAVVSGLLYLLSLVFVASPIVSVTILLLGRAMLGAAESFVVTGAMSWGLGLTDHRSAGRVMVWTGMAMYIAFALGAPAGSMLYEAFGFKAIAWVTLLAPLVTLLTILPLKGVAPSLRGRADFMKVGKAVLLPGLGLACCSLGFGATSTFTSLLFVSRGWSPAWLAFTCFAGAFIVARLLFGHMPDKVGGAKVALINVAIEGTGQALIWLAPNPAVALAGAMLSGFGYSLVYPGFGIEAVHRAPPESRGLAMGAYTAFLDLALGVGSPLLGLIASGAGLGAVFLATALAIFCAMPVALRLLLR